jgi:TM2 domain-containing membrane protein YozV
MTAAEYETAWLQSMTERQRALYIAEMRHARRSPGTAVLLAIFLGGLGAHRFYLGDLWGLVYVLFCLTLLPTAVSLLEALVMTRRVEEYNKQQAYRIAARIRASAGAGGA